MTVVLLHQIKSTCEINFAFLKKCAKRYRYKAILHVLQYFGPVLIIHTS